MAARSRPCDGGTRATRVNLPVCDAGANGLGDEIHPRSGPRRREDSDGTSARTGFRTRPPRPRFDVLGRKLVALG